MAIPGFTAEQVLQVVQARHHARVVFRARWDATLAQPCCSACDEVCEIQGYDSENCDACYSVPCNRRC